MSKKHTVIAAAGLSLWVAETAYFGFSAKPTNGVEGLFDALSTILILWGIVGDILTSAARGLKITKDYTINAKELSLYDVRAGNKPKTIFNTETVEAYKAKKPKKGKTAHEMHL